MRFALMRRIPIERRTIIFGHGNSTSLAHKSPPILADTALTSASTDGLDALLITALILVAKPVINAILHNSM